MNYHSREIEKIIKQYLNQFSVVGLTGPRQSGKATVFANSFSDYRYVTFRDEHTLRFFINDPFAFMKIYSEKVIFDEVQRVPEIFNHIKMAVDRDRDRKGKFILMCSAQFYFFKSIRESLAGRIGLLTLLPFQFSEVPREYRKQSVYAGSYPELSQRGYQQWEHWYASYLDSYIQKDVRDLGNIRSLRDFRRFLQLLAVQTAQTLNLSYYAKDIGVDSKTIKNWLSILEASYIVFCLPPYYKNYSKRLIKSPKLYFYDTGLVSYLTGVFSEEMFLKGPMAGQLFENYLVSELWKKETHQKTLSELFYLKTSNGEEVDVLIDRKTHKELFEIKLNSSFTPRMVRPLKTFLEKGDKAYLLYTGESLPHSEVSIMNYEQYLAL